MKEDGRKKKKSEATVENDEHGNPRVDRQPEMALVKKHESGAEEEGLKNGGQETGATSEDEIGAKEPSSERSGDQIREMKEINPRRRIFVSGLTQKTTSESIWDYFAQYGRIVETTVKVDENADKNTGYGFVTFKNEESAIEALKRRRQKIDGRKANVRKYRTRQDERRRKKSEATVKSNEHGNPWMDCQSKAAAVPRKGQQVTSQEDKDQNTRKRTRK